MKPETMAGLLALAWLIGSMLLMMQSIRRGRVLADTLAQRYPERYETLGRPRPGYLDSLQRTRFSRFVGLREYRELHDPALIAEFEAYRHAEARLLLLIVTSLAAVSLIAFWVTRRG